MFCVSKELIVSFRRYQTWLTCASVALALPDEGQGLHVFDEPMFVSQFKIKLYSGPHRIVQGKRNIVFQVGAQFFDIERNLILKKFTISSVACAFVSRRSKVDGNDFSAAPLFTIHSKHESRPV
jgi:hypothetical protein